jgi:hypothetical protein
MIAMRAQISYASHSRQRPHWWRALHRWQRVLLVVVVLGALLTSAGLIVFGAREPALVTPAPTTTTTQSPMYSPGTDEYYYWGQSQPLSQQP